VEQPGIPAGVSALVAGITVRDHDTAQRLVWNVIRRLSIRRRERAAMASSALVDHRHLRVVPLGRFPASRAVACDAIDSCRNMHCRLARSRVSIVTIRTICRSVEEAMVRLGRRPAAGRFVTTFTIAGHRGMNRRSRLARRTVAGVGMANSALA
jgi:hypothetical protein